jgi:SAM-dependent methyltransferase
MCSASLDRWDALTRDDQRNYWNDPDVAADLRARQSGVTDFAHEVDTRIARQSRLLELGCGAGDDAGFFAQRGHNVIATDVSMPLIDMAAQRYADLPNLEFRVADISQAFNVGGQSQDVVYSRLALQYFTHQTTMRVFSEISWVLRSGGQFFFACRSTEDPLYGKGEEVEPDMYELDGHVRHFFAPDYANELLEANGFTKIEVSTGKQKLYGEHAAYVKCSAIKP